MHFLRSLNLFQVRWNKVGSILVKNVVFQDLLLVAYGLRQGAAIRMAQDLGLNRNADKWQYRGNDLFTAQEKQMRKQLWFACVMADEYSAVYMGNHSLPILLSSIFTTV